MSDRLSGSYAARMFGDLGADVILAESNFGHSLRHEPPFFNNEAGKENSLLHNYVNWNKSSLIYERLDEINELVSQADILITTASPISFELQNLIALLKSNAIHLSITPHGLEGKLSSISGNNLTHSARTGWAYINGYLDEPPLQMPNRQSGYIAGIAGFMVASAALLRRDQLPTYELADVSEFEAFSLTVHPWGVAAVYQGVGSTYGPAGGRQRGEPHPLFSTSDGQIALAFGDWHHWPKAMDILNLPEFADHPDLVPDIGRHAKDLDPVRAGAARELCNLERWPLFHALSELRCVSGVVQDMKDIIENPHLEQRDFLRTTSILDKSIRMPGAWTKLTPESWELNKSAPQYGQHTSTFNSVSSNNSKKTQTVKNASHSEGPLHGVRVLSFGQAWSGTFGTELLGLLGADVIQIETVDRQDVWRRTRDTIPAGIKDPDKKQHTLNTQGLYNSVNLNKRAITLDLSQEEGLSMFWQMLPKFDILADNFRPNVMERWGITLEKLEEVCPKIIYASISSYGAYGPYKDFPGIGTTIEPMSGLSSIHGYENEACMNTGGLYPDSVAAYYFAGSVIGALYQRDIINKPQRIELSMLEAMITVCGDAVAEYDGLGSIAKPQGNHHPRISPHNIYPTTNNEWIAIAIESDNVWEKFVQFTDIPHLKNPEFNSMQNRKKNEKSLDLLIENWTIQQDAKILEDNLCELGIAAARVVPLYEVYSNPSKSSLDRGFIKEIDHPETGPTYLPLRPWKLSHSPNPGIRPSPCVGEHSQEVFLQELDIGIQRYKELVKDRITGTLYETSPEN